MRQISCTPQFIKLYLVVETHRQFCKSYNTEDPGYSICLGWVALIQVNNNNRRHGDIFWLFVTLISNFHSSLPNFLFLSKRLQGIQLQRNRDKPAIKISSQIPSRRVQSSNTAFISSPKFYRCKLPQPQDINIEEHIQCHILQIPICHILLINLML